MVENWEIVHEIHAKLKLLTPGDRMYIAHQIIGEIRNAHFVDHEKLRRQLDEMANDPGIQRALRNEDLPLEHLYCPPEVTEQRAAS